MNKFEQKHKKHRGFKYDSIHCLGYYCEQCNEFHIISGESKVVQKRVTPKIVNKDLVLE